MVKLFPKKKGRPKRPAWREKIELYMPHDLLDMCEDVAHQSDLTRTALVVLAVRAGLPIVAERLGAVMNREVKITYRDRSKDA